MDLFNKIISICCCAVILLSLSACVEKGNTDNQPKPENKYTGEYNFDNIFLDGNVKKLKIYDSQKPNAGNPQAEGNAVYNVYRKIGSKNYLKIELETDVDLVGYITYSDINNKGKKHTEKFFIQANAAEFTTFLDAFRVGAFGKFDKLIETVALQNVDCEKEGTVTLKKIGISDRTMDIYDDMYITDETIKFGTSLSHGGSIKHIERVDLDICEFMDSDGNICIDKDIDPDYYDVTNTEVNLVNIYDLGREIQPSYYLNVTKANGYEPKTKVLYNGLVDPLYNPIQCGSPSNKTPQIIDYEYKEDHIYVKTKAQDWFYDNDQANGYIETTYRFEGDGVLVVDNTYTDFSQFTQSDENPMTFSTQETPATYFVYPLNYFYCETRQGEIFDNTLKPQNGQFTCKSTKTQKIDGGYYYGIEGKNVKYDWCAFVNDGKFGVGIFMPNADVFIASRGATSCSYYQESTNKQIIDSLFSFEESEVVPSYAAFNYNYINPGVRRRMIDFVPLKYSYAIYVGDTQEMKNTFADLKESGKLTNSHLVDGSGWPKK